jgi:hypothetical protein
MPKFTRGPWAWHGNGTSSIHLATVDRGRTYVMSFQRWGMRSAQPTFQRSRRDEGMFGMIPAMECAHFEVGHRGSIGITAAKADDSVYRYDIVGLDHPDAILIASAPVMYEALVLARDAMVSSGPFDPEAWAKAVDAVQNALDEAAPE